MASKELYSFRENVREFLCDTMESFNTICKTVGSNKQYAVIDKKYLEILFRRIN